MPIAARRPCTNPTCPNLQPCEKHQGERRRQYDASRSRDESRRWYWTPAWRSRSKDQLHTSPLCADPYGLHKGWPTPAKVADHITPHGGNRELFDGPLQSLCLVCHQRKTREGL
jgi:5-methylcytosine-specific restriction protein A